MVIFWGYLGDILGIVVVVKNGRPNIKRARRTGLSAQRARRTKSRGSKGLQLEVRARGPLDF